MGYTQVRGDERWQIAGLRSEGASIREVARRLDRAPSTIARELKRNGSASGGYQSRIADNRARARRWTGSRLERDEALRTQVLRCLGWGWSPEQVSRSLSAAAGRVVTSHESIYRFIYAQIDRHQDWSWRRYLPQAKSRRGWRVRNGRAANTIVAWRPHTERPAEALDRERFGDWEADLMQFGRSGPVLLVLYERRSRMVLVARVESKASEAVAAAIARLLDTLPPAFRQTMTFDNGTEFAAHYRLHDLGVETFFCDTHSPWQKGGVENANGRLRRRLPRKTALGKLSVGEIEAVALAYNNTPRKCLGFQTPAQLFASQVLHFKCESAFRFSSE